MLDLQAEQHDVGRPYAELYEAVAGLKRRHDLHPCAVRPRDGLALRRDHEREAVQDLIKRFRELPPDQRRRLPALLNSLAQLEVVVGDLEAGQHDFVEVARLVSDPIAQAEAHHNVYRSALERRDWGGALASLRRAAALDPDAFEPFPLGRYEPLQILGAGGFGASFLCRDQERNTRVVVKALRPDALDRDAEAVFGECAAIQELDHPALIRPRAWGWADAEKARPYLVTEYFEGLSLMEHVARRGPLPPEDWLAVGWQAARALQALHGRGVLHRSLRPSAVLVRAEKAGDAPTVWRVKLLDAGLALRRAVIHAAASHPAACANTALGRSVARTVAYAPPEVVGRPKGHVWVGAHSDVYAFGKVAAFALTGRPDPDGGDLVLLPEPWKELLADLSGWTIGGRPAHFGEVLDRMARLPGAGDRVGAVERAMYESTIADHSAALAADPRDAAALTARGNAYARQGDFARAVADYTLAIQLRPDDASLFRRRAQAHARAQVPDKAAADFTESLQREPHNAEALAGRGAAHIQRQEYDRAVADFTEALKIDTRDEALHCNRGAAHLCREDYARAVADFTEALRLGPHNARALAGRGRAYVQMGEHGKAAADFGQLLRLDPGNARAAWDRARAHAAMGLYDRAVADYDLALRAEPAAALYHERGQALAALGEHERAVADFAEALALDPKHAGALLSRAAVRQGREEWREALADLDAALGLQADAPDVLARRADVRRRLGLHAEALADYTRALELAPDAADAWIGRAETHAAAGDLEEAAADFTAAIRLDPADAGRHMRRAQACAQLGDDERALADFTESIRLDPTNAAAHAARGAAHARAGEPARAVADFTEAIRLDPADAGTWHARGATYGDMGDLENALADFEEALRLDPRLARAFLGRGNVHARLGDHDLALADFEEALRLDPRLAAALNGRGNVRLRRGDVDGALADYDAAVAADPALAAARCNRAAARARRGDAEGALADYSEALRLDPGDVGAYHDRGRLYAERGDYERAIADNEEALKRAPDEPRTLNNLAWLLATDPRPGRRDAARAVEFARRACELTRRREAAFLDTLAAALAAAGKFAEAADQQREAVELAGADATGYEERLRAYEAGRAAGA